MMESGRKIYYWGKTKRLVCLNEEATPQFWDNQWKTDDFKEKVKSTVNSKYWRGFLNEYLPNTNSRILEGGCGCGHLVYAMSQWGYNVTGVDFAKKTIGIIKRFYPELDVRYGDVRNLDFGRETFDGYFSLGVIEHFWDGFEDIVLEIRRVLKDGGFLFLTLPCISRMDYLKICLNGYTYRDFNHRPKDFYQFAYRVSDVVDSFKKHGFICCKNRRRAGLIGLERFWGRTKFLRNLLGRLSKKNKLFRYIHLTLEVFLSPFFGHGVILVLKKCHNKPLQDNQ